MLLWFIFQNITLVGMPPQGGLPFDAIPKFV